MSKKDQRTPEENETFRDIRQQINDFVAREYGFYYQKAGQTSAHWLAVMPYKPELVEILLKKVTDILNIQTTNKTPVFMTHVISDVAYYLSQYARRSPDSINRNQTANTLKKSLIQTNAVLQGRFKITQKEKRERKRIKTQTARQIHGQVKDMFQEMQNDYKYHWSR